MMELFWFVLTAMVVITVHEAGHLIAAISCGIPVKRFSIGFGCPWFSKSIQLKSQPNPLELVLAPIPLGGYVSFETEPSMGTQTHPRIRTFDEHPIASRALTVIAGPLANFLFAGLIWFVVAQLGQTHLSPKWGQPIPGSLADRSGVLAGDRVRAIARQDQPMQAIHSLDQLIESMQAALEASQPLVLELERSGRVLDVVLDLSSQGLQGRPSSLDGLGWAGPWFAPVIGQVIAQGPADRAGLQAGDWVVAINGQSVPDAVSLKRLISNSAVSGIPNEQIWEVLRGSRSLNLRVQPERIEHAGQWEGRVQVRLGSQPERLIVKWDPASAIFMAWDRLARTSLDMGQALIGAFNPAVSANQAQWVGPLGVAQIARQSADTGLEPLLLFVASLSLSLAWLNLLPIPVLDGGQLVFLTLEAISGPGLANWLRQKLTRFGVFLLLGLMAWAIYNDASRIILGSVLPR